MPYQTLKFDVKDGVASIVLNRPESYNALNETLMDELATAFYAADDPDIRAVYLTGEGKAFCSGGDVKAFAQYLQNPSSFFKRVPEKLHQAILAIRRLPKPVIAAVNGVAAGAGFSLAMACDIAVAVENTYFNLAYSRIGLSPDGSSTFFLPRLIGMNRALYYAFTGEDIPVALAKEWGIVHAIYPAATFRNESMALALKLAQGPTRALGKAKQLMNQSFENTLETQLGAETQGIWEISMSRDFLEGVMAFAEKRKPTFSGK